MTAPGRSSARSSVARAFEEKTCRWSLSIMCQLSVGSGLQLQGEKQFRWSVDAHPVCGVEAHACTKLSSYLLGLQGDKVGSGARWIFNPEPYRSCQSTSLLHSPRMFRPQRSEPLSACSGRNSGVEVRSETVYHHPRTEDGVRLTETTAM